MPEFNFLTTHVGSVPHLASKDLAESLAKRLDIPAWPQLPRRDFHESMYVQYSSSLPVIRTDPGKEKIYFDTSQDITSELENFYTPIVADDVDCFALKPEYATGFFDMLGILHTIPGEWAKGQVTGPISFGLTVTDQNLRASLYHDLLSDVIVKNAAMHARWQVRQLRSVRPKVIIFIDEPYLASFGSAFINLSREQVLTMLDEVFAAVHTEGAIAGIHCCGNTDWGLLLSTQVDILNLDAYGYIENLALYPQEMREFIDRGGAVCWGIVPNHEGIKNVSAEELATQLREGLKMISARATGRGVRLAADGFSTCSLISPACGLGSTSIEISEEVFDKLVRTGDILKQG